MLGSQTKELRKAAERLEGYQNGEISRMLREAADTIENLRDRLQDADVAYNDADVLGDVTQGLFRDLMAADSDTARLWARSWPELFGGHEKAVESESYGKIPEQAKCEDEGERESYDAGFSNGVKATLQQLDGLIHDGADVDEIQGWIDRQWEEEL